jgi:hypothetical protein
MGKNGGEEAERGKGKWRGGRGAREGSKDLAGRERSAGSAGDAAGDGASYSASSRRRSGVGERDMPVAWSSDERAVDPGVGGVSCKIAILATPPSDALYMPLGHVQPTDGGCLQNLDFSIQTVVQTAHTTHRRTGCL